MAFDWFAFFAGLAAAAVVAGFTMTVGGPDTAVAAVAIPLAVGAIGMLVVLIMRRRTGAQEAGDDAEAAA